MAEYYNGLTCRLELGNVPLGHVLDPQLEPCLDRRWQRVIISRKFS